MKTVMELYHAIEANGRLLFENGLCVDVQVHLNKHVSESGKFLDLIKLFVPEDWYYEDGVYWGYNGMYWGYNGEVNPYSRYSFAVRSEFTPLRQTILLFMAAMNDEL